MFSMSEIAANELNEFFKDKEKSPLRVYLASGGCSGQRLALAMDKPGEGDVSEDVEGYTFCVEKDLYALTGDIKVDLSYMGFVVDSTNPVGEGGGCSSCGGGCCSGQ
ncbi:heme biosynthesis protein HemY [Deltaproteobacteria bacterium]|nr:heme biosynthesis protein HemY [Deltaproteobacteria bacterium]